MKKTFTLLAAAALLILPSCRFIKISEEVKQQIKENGITWSGDNAGETITASDNYITRDETTGEFHALSCNLPGDILYTPGPCALSIYASDNVLEHVTVRNESGTLEIKSDLKSIRNAKNIKINVSSPVLEGLNVNGAVDFKAPQGITALDFVVTINGAGDLEIDGLKSGKAVITVNGAGDADIHKIDCDALTVAINGAGDAVLDGKVSGKADLSISGAGDIDATALKTGSIETNVRGIGMIRRPKT